MTIAVEEDMADGGVSLIPTAVVTVVAIAVIVDPAMDTIHKEGMATGDRIEDTTDACLVRVPEAEGVPLGLSL